MGILDDDGRAVVWCSKDFVPNAYAWKPEAERTAEPLGTGGTTCYAERNACVRRIALVLEEMLTGQRNDYPRQPVNELVSEALQAAARFRLLASGKVGRGRKKRRTDAAAGARRLTPKDVKEIATFAGERLSAAVHAFIEQTSPPQPTKPPSPE